MEIRATTANERLKSSFNSWFWVSMIAAAVFHFAAFALWPDLTAPDVSIDPTILEAIDLPPTVDIPEAPEEILAPARPVIADTEIEEDLTIPRTTFDEYVVNELRPPPQDERRDVSPGPAFTPFTVAPRILNGGQVVTAMRREYPALLRDAGIGGTVQVHFLIDEEGQVQATRILETSGHGSLDAAALAVAEVFRFSPALNRDQRVAVWVVFPIVFRVEARGE